MRKLRARYPWVRTWAAWNEANHKKQPLFRKPKRAAQFYNVMREECRGCTIVAADVLDSSNMLPWLATFKRYARHPRIWGLHSYTDTNHFKPLRATSTRALLRAVRGQVWLTETGGIVRFADRYHGGKRAERRAAPSGRPGVPRRRDQPAREARLPLPLGRRPALPHVGFGLRAARTGRARPALDVLRRELNRQRARHAEPPLRRFSRYPRHKLPLA